MKVLFAAGSSGGHIFPAIAAATELKNMDKAGDIRFVGGSRDIDREILGNAGYKYYSISSRNRIMKDLVSSFVILRKFRPDLAVGFGGYVSFPVLVTARILGIPTMVHEQNVFPGLANRMLSKFANKIAVSFIGSNNFFMRKKAVVETGNPLRPTLVKMGRAEALAKLGLDEKKFTILITGGSQGAHFINEAVLAALNGMDKVSLNAIQIIHLSGAGDYEMVAAGYKSLDVVSRVFSFFTLMDEAYSASDLVISRAGATTISELALFEKPAILIPYPSPKVHQLENARFLEKNGAAIVIEQAGFSNGRFTSVILDLITDRDRLRLMSEKARSLSRPDAAKRLAQEIVNVVKC